MHCSARSDERGIPSHALTCDAVRGAQFCNLVTPFICKLSSYISIVLQCWNHQSFSSSVTMKTTVRRILGYIEIRALYAVLEKCFVNVFYASLSVCGTHGFYVNSCFHV